MSVWRKEFPSYPVEAMPAIPHGWIDVSWHNDACPRFVIPSLCVSIWIDWPDPADREAGGKRFIVNVCDPDTHEMPDDGFLYEDDDWLRLLGWLVALEMIVELGRSRL